MRKIATLNIPMGLWNIPLDVNSLIDYSGVGFKMLCPNCMTKINMIRKCLKCNREIAYSDLKWGYQLSKDKIIPINKQMLKSLEKGNTKILMGYETDSKFSSLEEIIQSKVYLLTPNKDVPKPFFLLRDLLLKKKKSLLIQYVIRSKIHLGVIKVKTLTDRFGVEHSFLLLKQIVYSDSIRPIKPFKKEVVTEEELKLGIELFELVEQKSEKKDYTSIKDNRKKLLEKLLKGEIKEVETVEKVKEKELIEQLKSSVKTIKKKKKVKKSVN